MRLQRRPKYMLDRAVQQALVNFSVGKNNRAVADAFRETSGFAYRSKLLRSSNRKSLSFPIALVLVFGALAYSIFQYRYHIVNISIPTLPSNPTLQSKPPEPALASLIPAPVLGPVEKPETPEIPKIITYPLDGNVLIACKRDRTLYVYKSEDSKWTRLAAFPMAIGRNSGDKGDDGDLRTPEGRFWITELLAGPSQGKMYGPLILTLNYPRPGDLAEGKTGKGIWIHGVEMGKNPTFTHGCLSLANEDMLSLANYADIATPVIILSDTVSLNPAQQIDLAGMQSEYPTIIAAHGRKSQKENDAKEKILDQARKYIAKESKDFPELDMQVLTEQDKAAILARLDQWRADWTSRSIDNYATNYSESFRDKQGRDKAAFLERKRKIFASKSKIEMEIKDPRIEMETYSRVKVSFRQDYIAEGPQGVQRSSDAKSLRLDEGPSGWTIITE